MREVRNYPKEFKLEAVKLYIQRDRGLSETAKELGIPFSTLKGWRDMYMTEIKNQDKEKKPKKDYQEIIKNQEKKIKDLEEENLILKKSIGIFTKPLQQK